ncbi:bifunctional diguanylate cyclase/phosphodiesterase [Salinisphaera sp. LB1]|uniref:putative bifunctional diguanylate cyclase/phosphodiesterase n=1 Tax=Salinisphaera sp. LB1 TaxID=2183911 RepID=UPI000D707420|nr:EAL domain-containing protein [Salinisphaera sp. LB1]
MTETQCWERLGTGLALLDDRNVVIYANPAFHKVMALETASGALAITNWARGLDAEIGRRLERLLIASEAGALTLDVRAADPVTLYLGERCDGLRLVVAGQGWAVADERALAGQLDPLTGLGNRLMYERCLAKLVERGARPALAVLVIDLDRFKQVNDTLGHTVGDELLQLTANRLRALTREDDVLIRLGGDEFLVLQPDARQPDAAHSLANRLTEVMSRPFLVDGHQIDISASIGVAMFGHGTAAVDDLLKHANLALYEAKGRGRGRHCVFEPAYEARAMARRQLEIDLRRALALRQFELVYQPQNCTCDGRILGFEALLRWTHPRRGSVSPAVFIPVAEEIGEIHAIGAWVIRNACADAAGWTDPGLTVAVNVSPVQFYSDDLIGIVVAALEDSGLAASRLEIEITEGVMLAQSPNVLERLWTLHRMGVSIALDDFGTGYASLSYLNSFPFSKIKIDKSFVQSECSSRSQALISAILVIGSSLDMTTVAEGVETPHQFAVIRASGGYSVQGYYFSRPMPGAEVTAYLQAFDPEPFLRNAIEEQIE